jgi:uncharacterized membrane protein YfcA
VFTPWLAAALVAIVGFLAGAIAAVAGFGVGSLLTPLLAIQLDIRLAVAVVSIPHLLSTALRYWLLRRHVDWRVVRSFGLASAAGGVLGAYLGTFLSSPLLTAVLGCLLLFAAGAELTGWSKRLRFSGWRAWLAGGVSGVFGGLVGNQGGIRSAALLNFDLRKQAFVATATVVGLIVDGTRVPIYLFAQHKDLAAAWPYLLAASIGTVAGTLSGERLLRRIPEPAFRTTVSGILLVLGALLLFAAIRHANV